MASQPSSAQNSADSTRSSSPCPSTEVWVSHSPIHPLSPMLKPYPKPAYEVSVQEGLERPPVRWSIRGQMEANRQREATTRAVLPDSEARRREFEQVKKALLESHSAAQAKRSA